MNRAAENSVSLSVVSHFYGNFRKKRTFNDLMNINFPNRMKGGWKTRLKIGLHSGRCLGNFQLSICAHHSRWKAIWKNENCAGNFRKRKNVPR